MRELHRIISDIGESMATQGEKIGKFLAILIAIQLCTKINY